MARLATVLPPWQWNLIYKLKLPPAKIFVKKTGFCHIVKPHSIADHREVKVYLESVLRFQSFGKLLKRLTRLRISELRELLVVKITNTAFWALGFLCILFFSSKHESYWRLPPSLRIQPFLLARLPDVPWHFSGKVSNFKSLFFFSILLSFVLYIICSCSLH